jgi:type II secretion system protein G
MKNKAFTLIELLVVIAILGILATIGIGGFRSSQIRSRDAQRKSDLKQIASALELYYSDYGKYPAAGTGGVINGCPAETDSCTWGNVNIGFQDSQGKIYLRQIPKDPQAGNYYYRVSANKNKFQLFTHLENSQDKNCVDANCATTDLPSVCGTGLNCNYAVTSTNAGPKESI